MPMYSINPATGETLREFATHTPDQIEQIVARAAAVFQEHRKTPLEQRSQWMNRAAEILEAESEEFGLLMALEMGKTRRSAVEEARKCAKGCRYYAENAERFLAEMEVQTDAARSSVRFQPLGPVLAIMPWNFPFWQVFRFAAPALMAGNVGLLKHAGSVPQCALAIEDIFGRAGFPEGAFQTLLIDSEHVGPLLEDPRIAAATLTGSEGAGRAVASRAEQALKKVVLELGGSDPFIVMPSANLGEAASTAVTARTINNGQSCIAAKRFIVQEEIADEFERRFIERFSALRVGNPMEEATDVGPLATAAIRDGLNEQVQKSIQMGARALYRANIEEGPGFYFPPTVLANVPRESPAYREELFGPVASLFRVRDIDEAITLANDTHFGLGSSGWTNDSEEQERFIDELQAGLVFINGMVASDPRLPFGGVKSSGFGRELGEFGIREFVNIKTVWIEGSEKKQTGTE